MGEQVILVCDVCGRPATQTVTIKVGRTNYAKDVCETHLSELTAGARRPRPGRRRAAIAAGESTPRRRGRPPKSAAAPSGNGRRRRGRPPKAPAESGSSSS
jgi:hypothetical protein